MTLPLVVSDFLNYDNHKEKLMLLIDFVQDTIKESLRVGIIAAIAVILPQLEMILTTGVFVLDWKVAALAGAIAFFKGIDRAAHNLGKEIGSETIEKGLLRF